MGYKYSIVGYISIYSNKDFSRLKNDLFDFQLALLSNKLEFLCGFRQNDLLWQLYQLITITLKLLGRGKMLGRSVDSKPKYFKGWPYAR